MPLYRPCCSLLRICCAQPLSQLQNCFFILAQNSLFSLLIPTSPHFSMGPCVQLPESQCYHTGCRADIAKPETPLRSPPVTDLLQRRCKVPECLIEFSGCSHITQNPNPMQMQTRSPAFQPAFMTLCTSRATRKCLLSLRFFHYLATLRFYRLSATR